MQNQILLSFFNLKENPNHSLVIYTWFGLYWLGAEGGSRTRTRLTVMDSEPIVSAISPLQLTFLFYHTFLYFASDFKFI